jgi:hypothetical protein
MFMGADFYLAGVPIGIWQTSLILPVLRAALRGRLSPGRQLMIVVGSRQEAADRYDGAPNALSARHEDDLRTASHRIATRPNERRNT